MIPSKNGFRNKTKSNKKEKLRKVVKVKNIKANENIKKTLTKKETKQAINEVIAEVETTKKVKYVMPSKYITEGLVNSCLNALQQLSLHFKKKNTIFEDETVIFAEINCIKIQKSKGNIRLLLPHSTVASTGEVCLITPDLKKGAKADHEPTIEHWEEILRKAGVTSIKTILPMRQLRVEYDQYELKRRLLTQHDFIMVDTRVLNHVSHLVGKIFFKKHNMLIPVRLNKEENIKKDIDVGLRTVMLRLGEGPTSAVVVGHTGMPQNDLKDNVISLVQQLKEKFPGGQANIRSLSLKLPLSLPLPLYITLRPSNIINVPKLNQKKPKHFTVLEDELSTMQGRKVRVAPDGTVHVVNKHNKKNNKKISNMLNKVKEEGNEDEEEEEEDVEEEVIQSE